MVKIIVTRVELEALINERFGTTEIKWNKEGNALVEVDASEILSPYKVVNEK